MKNLKKLIKKQGFTLVELIIVIAIIAVLAVAAFMILTKWLGKSRDSRKLADIETISKSLMIWLTDPDNPQGIIPEPDNSGDILFDGVVVWNQGVFGEGVISKMDGMQKAPKNPNNNSYYTYSRTTDGKKYQIATELEDGSEATAISNNVFASTAVNAMRGNFYPGIFIFPTDTTILKAIYLPSIVGAGVSSGNDIKNTQSFVLDGKSDNLIDSGDSIKTYKEIVGSTIDLDTVWSGTVEQLSEPTTLDSIVTTMDGMVVGSITTTQVSGLLADGGTSTPVVESSDEGSSGGTTTTPSCAIQPSYTHANFVVGSPSTSNTSWQNTNSSEACYYSCTDGYGGNNCTTPPSCATQPSYTNATFTVGIPTAPNMGWQTTDDSAPCYFACNSGFAFNGSDCSETFTIISSCKTLYDKGERGDGTYTVEIAGGGVMDVYCDMTTDGGGWTLVGVGQDGNTIDFLPNGEAHGTVTIPTQGVAGNLAFTNRNNLGTMVRWKYGSYKYYTKHGSQAITTNGFITTYNKEPIPSCSSNMINWSSGRAYHIGDCYGAIASHSYYTGYGWNGTGLVSNALMNQPGSTAWVR